MRSRHFQPLVVALSALVLVATVGPAGAVVIGMETFNAGPRKAAVKIDHP